jgi:fumarate reductase flavoprotein subunit
LKPWFCIGSALIVRNRMLAVTIRVRCLNINRKLQPLDKDWEVIPGIYLAGNTMGNRFAVDYPTMCPGLSHGMAIYLGRIAGMNAALQK